MVNPVNPLDNDNMDNRQEEQDAVMQQHVEQEERPRLTLFDLEGEEALRPDSEMILVTFCLWAANDPMVCLQIGHHKMFLTFQKSVQVFRCIRDTANNTPDLEQDLVDYPCPSYSWWMLFDSDQPGIQACQELSCTFSLCHGIQVDYHAQDSFSQTKLRISEDQAVRLKHALERGCNHVQSVSRALPTPLPEYVLQPRACALEYTVQCVFHYNKDDRRQDEDYVGLGPSHSNLWHRLPRPHRLIPLPTSSSEEPSLFEEE